MTKFLEKYNNIIENYHKGVFGEENLSLFAILQKANEPDIINSMCLSELEQLKDDSTGFMKQYFMKIFLQRKIDIQKIAKLESELHTFRLEPLRYNGENIDEHLAAELKLKIEYIQGSDFPADVEATLSPSSDARFNGVIKVLKGSETKFPYMHEIIHYFRDVGEGKPVQAVYARKRKGKTESKKEQQINYLTAAAIMPYKEVEQYLDEFESISKMEEEGFFRRIADVYGQVIPTVKRRIIEVRNLVDFRAY